MRRLLLVALALALAAPAEARQAERQATSRAIAALGSAVTVWPPHRSRPSAIRNLAVAVSGRSDVERARRFIALYPALFVAGLELRHDASRATRDLSVVRFQQLHRGIPVEGAVVIVALDGAGRVRAVSSEAEAVAHVRTTPRLTRSAAARIAYRISGHALDGASPSDPSATLTILPGPTTHLAYKVMMPIGANLQGRVCFVNAETGAHLGWRRATIVDGLAPGREVRP